MIDELDISILRELWKSNGMTSSKIAKRVFEINDSYTMKKRDSFCKKRLEKLESIGIITCNQGFKKTYTINKENCHLGEGSLTVKSGPSFDISMGEILIIKVNNKLIYFQV